MADLPFELPADLSARLLCALDVEGKIPRGLDALGPLAGRDVVLIDGDGGVRARQLAALGAHLTVLERPERVVPLQGALAGLGDQAGVREGSATRIPLPDESADAVVACWSAFRGPAADELAEADRVLRPAGRLLVLHDYGRDDVQRLLPEAYTLPMAWSRRDGPFLAGGFRIRVIHCWWTFESVEAASGLLARAFGERGAALAAELRRPRLSYNVAVYHRGGPPSAEVVLSGDMAASAARPG